MGSVELGFGRLQGSIQWRRRGTGSISALHIHLGSQSRIFFPWYAFNLWVVLVGAEDIGLGTAVYLLGSANCTYDVSIDSGSGSSGLSSTSNVLFAKTGLSQGTHLVSVTAHASQTDQFAFDSAIITDVIPDGYACFPEFSEMRS